ncbi:vang-like protein 2-B [Patiria miniata]|uniref:Vang-like protein n=1 Tax=Patiria miniata TaxID=46514 RepID=A0A914ARC5_PATMI|nr:vang-like protein 2-B [Patiria miniata]XP_038066208.1 vang-like protein 2-B [Patiria miniata]
MEPDMPNSKPVRNATTPSNHTPNRSGRHRDRYRDRDTDEESEKGHRSRRRRERDVERGEDYDGDRSHRSHNRSSRSVSIMPPQPQTTDDERDEVVEVEILPQDDNWGDNTTAITGTSDRSSMEDLTQLAKSMDDTGFDCSRYLGYVLAVVIGLVAFLSPIAFVIIPIILRKQGQCGTACDGLFISMAFKLLILLIGSWALFFRRPKASFPRMFVFRLVVMGLLLVLVTAYWLFFGVRVMQQEVIDYKGVVQYAVSLVDALLFIHYVAVILLELRQLQPMYAIKVVRSPDGASKYYTVGMLSIQRCAAWILENYYRDFTIFNPHLLRVPTSRVANKLSNFKVYDVDGPNESVTGRSRAILAATAHRRDQSRNERFYEKQEYERRVKKRRARLEVAAEEAFTHIKRLHEDQSMSAHVMDPTEAAQAIFPSMARSLQKYLRVTRQQPRWTMDAVIGHLTMCISYNLSPKAFLEAFFEPGPNIVQSVRDGVGSQPWELVSDTLVSRPIKEGGTFQLRQGEVMLQVYVMRIPHLKVKEEAYDYKNNRFALRLQSETSV